MRDVTLRFGGLTSLNKVNLTHNRGEVLSVIGPNGAGKTSLFNCLTGVYTPQEGSITLAGEPIETGTWRRLVAQVPQTPWLTPGTIAVES